MTAETRQLFIEVKLALNVKEEEALRNIQTTLKKEQTVLENRYTQNTSQIESLEEFDKDWGNSEAEDEIKLLTKSKMRHQIADKGLSKIIKTSFNKVFNEFRRDTELVHISKAIQHTPQS